MPSLFEVLQSALVKRAQHEMECAYTQLRTQGGRRAAGVLPDPIILAAIDLTRSFVPPDGLQPRVSSSSSSASSTTTTRASMAASSSMSSSSAHANENEDDEDVEMNEDEKHVLASEQKHENTATPHTEPELAQSEQHNFSQENDSLSNKLANDNNTRMNPTLWVMGFLCPNPHTGTLQLRDATGAIDVCMRLTPPPPACCVCSFCIALHACLCMHVCVCPCFLAFYCLLRTVLTWACCLGARRLCVMPI